MKPHLTKADRIDLSRGGVEILAQQSDYWIGIRKHTLPEREWFEFGRVVKENQKSWARYEQVSNETFAVRQQAIDYALTHFELIPQPCSIIPTTANI
jgi:hypothetical protein